MKIIIEFGNNFVFTLWYQCDQSTLAKMHTLLTADRRRCDLIHVTVLLLLGHMLQLESNFGSAQTVSEP